MNKIVSFAWGRGYVRKYELVEGGRFLLQEVFEEDVGATGIGAVYGGRAGFQTLDGNHRGLGSGFIVSASQHFLVFAYGR